MEHRRKKYKLNLKDIKRAETAIKWDDQVPNEYCNLFILDGEIRFSGNSEQLDDILKCIQRYVEKEAKLGEGRAFFDSKERLSSIDVPRLERI